MKTWVKQGSFVAIPLLALTAIYAAARPPAEEAEAAFESESVERRPLEVTAEAAGLIEPIRVVEVMSKASGEILRLTVETGDAVRRGDLLGEVDPRDVRNAWAQAQADLDVAEARMATAQAQRARSTELRAANVITEQEFDAAKLEEANARAQYVKAQVNLELAEERRGDVTIRAPIDGVIIRRDVEEGQIIQSASQNISGGTTVFLMADLQEMQVRTLVSETDLGSIQPGMSARVNVEAFPGRPFQGTVTKIEPQAVVDQNVTMFPVLVHLSNRDDLLKPGMNAEVIVEIARRAEAVTVPNAAVVGMRDAMAAGALFGISEDQMRTALRGGRGGAPDGAAAQGAANGQSGNGPAANGAAAQGPPAPAAAQARQGRGGPDNARGAMRAGMSGRGGDMAAGGEQDVRPGIVFVQTAAGVEPRSVLLGVNDWDFTEVISGVEPGERVVLISVARLQQQQQDMLDRMRERNSGPFPGAGRR